MGKTALFATRDVSGLEAFAENLKIDFDYRIVVVDSVVEEGRYSTESVNFETARELIERGEASLVLANYFDPTMIGRDYLSWKSALKAFDYEIADLIRAAARQPQSMAVLGDPSLYGEARELLKKGEGKLPARFRLEQACNALHAVSQFDASVAQYLESQGGDAPDIEALGGFPKTLTVSWKRSHSLEEGESSRQKAGLYGTYATHFEAVSGPEVDYKAVIDSSLATYAIGEFEKTTAIIAQRGTLVSAASADTLQDAIQLATASVEGELTHATLVVNASIEAEDLATIHPDAFSTVIAPSFSDRSSDHGFRLLESREGLGYEALQEMKTVVGGILVQDRNRIAVNPFSWRMPSANQPLVTDWESMLFGVKISRHLQSSACVAIREERVVARATGLTNQGRFASRLGEAGVSLEGVILVFDEDIVEPKILDMAKRLGSSVVVHAGVDGSKEGELVERANQLGIALVVTGVSFCKF